MTGNQLKIEIKKLGLTQEGAAAKLGVTRQTLGLWLNRADLDNTIVQLAMSKLGINPTSVLSQSSDLLQRLSELTEQTKSQQETIKNLSETIKNLTSK